jgi:hypothetical protein
LNVFNEGTTLGNGARCRVLKPSPYLEEIGAVKAV